MIRKTWNSDKWLLTSQSEHARLAAIIAASWKFPDEKPCEQFFKAVMGHDDGWKDNDALPELTPDGDPRSFHEVKPVAAMPMFDRSIALRREANQPYAAALVVGHFLWIAENTDLARCSVTDMKAIGSFISRNRRLLTELKADLSKDEAGTKLLPNYDKDLRFLQVCDYLSLLLCTDFNGEEIIENVPFLAEGDSINVSRKTSNLALTLNPLPFKKNLRDHLSSWVVPYIPYDSAEELAAAMEEVKQVTNEVHLGAGTA